jgi:hypothetical protein
VRHGPVDLADSETRRRLTPAAARLAVRLADLWGLTDVEMTALLGDVSADTWRKMLAGEFDGTLSEESLFRAGILLKIFGALNTLFVNDLRNTWLRMPNSGPPFGGRSPAATMVEGGLPSITEVLQHLESWAAGNA